MIVDAGAVSALPSKRFFVRMLTKDIELIPAILDLVDNSVDGALALRGDGSFSGLHVDIDISPSEFVIQDNCGGIDVNTARQYAFRFGRPEGFKGVEGAVGQFGIGMKRALFKLGRQFTVESTARSSSFRLEVDVAAWESDESREWTFPLQEADEGEDNADSRLGTRVIVDRLHDGVAHAFSLSPTIGKLRSELGLRHEAAMRRGLRVTVNEDEIRAEEPKLLQSPTLMPVSRTFDISANGATVQAHLYAGIVSIGDADKDDGEAEDFTSPSMAGWYLYCNGRLLLSADKTTVTGWGVAGPMFHPQYRQFRGYLYLNAADPSLLPWNTAKTSVDEDAIVYRRARSEMIKALSQVIALLNAAKRERSQIPEEDRVLVPELVTAPMVAISNLNPSEAARYPQPRRRGGAPADIRRIQYVVDRDDFEAVAEMLGADSGSEVGRETFRYYYEHEVAY